MNALPENCVLRIADHLDSISDLIAISELSQRWRKIIYEWRQVRVVQVIEDVSDRRMLRIKRLDGCFPLFSCLSITLRRFTRITRLVLSNLSIKNFNRRKILTAIRFLSITVTHLEFVHVETTSWQWESVVPAFLRMPNLTNLVIEGCGKYYISTNHVQSIRSRISFLKLHLPVRVGLFMALCSQLKFSLQYFSIDLFKVIWIQGTDREIAVGLGLLTGLKMLVLHGLTNTAIANNLRKMPRLESLVLITEPNRVKFCRLCEYGRFFTEKVPSWTRSITIAPFDPPLKYDENGQITVDLETLIEAVSRLEIIRQERQTPLRLSLGVDSEQSRFPQFLLGNCLVCAVSSTGSIDDIIA